MSSESIGYVFVNGLNDGETKPQDRIADAWWRRRGISLTHAHVDWFKATSVVAEARALEATTHELLQSNKGVVLLGNSAGGSLALNTFARIHSNRVALVSAHARLAEGDYPDSDSRSLYKRAKMHTPNPSPLFIESVRAAELAAATLSPDKRERTLTLSSRTDNVVPPELMTIDGVRNHEAAAYGHLGGWAAHMIADRDLIIEFVEEQLA
jgi:pimeloyl-ACP methyl ester carboxylesterase